MYNLRSDPKITGRWVNDGSHLTFIKPNGKDTPEYLFFTHNCGVHTVGISVYLKDNSVLVTLQDKKKGDLRFISAVGDIIIKPLSKVQQVAIH